MGIIGKVLFAKCTLRSMYNLTALICDTARKKVIRPVVLSAFLAKFMR